MWVVVKIDKASGYATADAYPDRSSGVDVLLEFKDRSARQGRLIDFWLHHGSGGAVESYAHTVYLVEAAMGGLSHGGSSESRGVTGSNGVTGSMGVTGKGEQR